MEQVCNKRLLFCFMRFFLPPLNCRERRNHEHQEHVVRYLRQEPAEGHRLRVVYFHRIGGGSLHLRLRCYSEKWRGGQHLARVRCYLDGAFFFCLLVHRMTLGDIS